MIDTIAEARSYLDKIDFDKPKDKQKILDDQQIHVCCHEGNTVVAAGAGSGKTQVLADRFAYLVISNHIPVEKILTLTFTNKAANEMYARIYRTLSNLANPECGINESQRKYAAEAVENFSKAHIQTLDSYCSSIVHQAANRYGIRPDFSVGTSDADRIIKNMALPFILKHRNDPAIIWASEPGKLQEVAEDLFAYAVIRFTSLASSKDFFSSYLSTQCKSAADAWNYYTSGQESANPKEYIPLEKLISHFEESYSSLSEKDAQNQFVINFNNAVQNRAADPFEITPEDISSLSCKDKVKEYMEFADSLVDAATGTTVPKKKPGESENPISKYAKKGVKSTRDMLASIASYIDGYDNLVRLYALMDEFLASVNQSKRETGALSFRDVSDMALKILAEEQDVHIQEQQAYDRIMIDEFQDNNGRNRDLLFLLAEKVKDAPVCITQEMMSKKDGIESALKDNLCADKLFFVGDEKQSIYKFRGADVAVFRELNNDLHTEPIPMIYNYRSSNELLSSFNQIFGGWQNGTKMQGAQNAESNPTAWVFPSKALHTYEAEFTEKTQAHKNKEGKIAPFAQLTSQNIPVHVCMVNEKDDILTGDKQVNNYFNAKEQVSYFIASKIKQLVEQKKYSYRDIAILDRSRTDRSIIARFLSMNGIPYVVDMQDKIFSEAIVNDMYNFMRLCVYPSDRSAFAVLLRSPFANLSEAGMEAACAVLFNPKENSNLKNDTFTAFDSGKSAAQIAEDEHILSANLSEADYKKYLDAKNMYLSMKENVLRQTLTKTVSSLWYDNAYRYEILWNKKTALFEDHFDFIYELARIADSEGRSISWFIDQLSAKKKQEQSTMFGGDDSDIDTDDVDYPREATDAVQIMTIHKSKGLEFPVVFVYGCSDKPQNRDRSGTVYYSEEDGVSINLRESGTKNFFFLKQKLESDAKADAEFRRVFYVALTRAEQEAYITGSWAVEKPKSPASSAPAESTSSPDDEDTTFSFENCIRRYYSSILDSTGIDEGTTQFAELSPFDYTAIKPVSREEAASLSQESKTDTAAKSACIESVSPVYESAEIINTPDVPYNRFSPSSLEPKFDESTQSTSGTRDQLDIIINKTKKEIVKDGTTSYQYDFGYNDFGTLAHAYMEAYANGIAPESFASSPMFASQEKLFKKLNKTDSETVKNICISLAQKFISSGTGKLLHESTEHRAEYGFRSYLAHSFVTGSIDLIMKTAEGKYIIVDYKTDQAKQPEKYYEQLCCYRKAAADLYSISENQISCVLFYLRFGEAVDITKEVSSVTEDQISAKIEHTVS